MDSLWFTVLYQPLFNALIYIYSNFAGQNLGWAVVILTLFLRIVLLPFTILSERNITLQKKAEVEAREAVAAFRHDPVAQKEEFRRIMKKHRISPWAKVITLAVQVVVFLLLYQVFVRGISGERILPILYSFVDFPGKINTNFYGFDIGRPHDLFWSGLCGMYIFVSTWLGQRRASHMERSDLFFLVFFPLSIFLVLWWLPMVKSLFILTTMLFSDIIALAHRLFFGEKNHGHDSSHGHH